MLRGGFLSGGMLDDILLIALMDTGVPVWAFDPRSWTARRHQRRASRASSSDAPATRRCCRTGASSWPTPASPLAALFGEHAPGTRRGSRTRRVTLYSVLVPGVPPLYAEEALWATRARCARLGVATARSAAGSIGASGTQEERFWRSPASQS